MVHALSGIHRALTPGGVLVDIHPEPEDNLIEIWQEGTIHRLGPIDQTEDHAEIEAARECLRRLEDEGLFVSEETRYFDLLEHHPSVESWRARWEAEDYRLVAPADMFDTAHSLLESGGGELVIREAVRAMRLLRSEPD